MRDATVIFEGIGRFSCIRTEIVPVLILFNESRRARSIVPYGVSASLTDSHGTPNCTRETEINVLEWRGVIVNQMSSKFEAKVHGFFHTGFVFKGET